MIQQHVNVGLRTLAAVIVCAPAIAGAYSAGSANYELEAVVMDGAGGVAHSMNYAALSATAQPAVTGAGSTSAYAFGHGFINALAGLQAEGEPVEGETIEGEIEGEPPVEGETLEGEPAEGEGEQPEGETEGEPVEGEPIEGETTEGEIEGELVEGEPTEGEGEDGCCAGCGCGGGVKANFNRYLGDFLLLGILLVSANLGRKLTL